MNLEAKIDNALSSYWKLKAIDSMDLSLGQERNKVISVLIDNQEIESILMKEELQSFTQPASSRTQNRHDTLVTVPNLLYTTIFYLTIRSPFFNDASLFAERASRGYFFALLMQLI